MRIRIKRLPCAHDIPLPAPASPGSSGFDLRAAVPTELVIAPGERLLIPTGVALEIPAGWEGQVRARSGLALRHGIGLVNAPGTIDSDYRGEVSVILINLGREPFAVRRGDRIAQLVFTRIERIEWEETDSLCVSERGGGGFGSSGVA